MVLYVKQEKLVFSMLTSACPYGMCYLALPVMLESLFLFASVFSLNEHGLR